MGFEDLRTLYGRLTVLYLVIAKIVVGNEAGLKTLNRDILVFYCNLFTSSSFELESYAVLTMTRVLFYSEGYSEAEIFL